MNRAVALIKKLPTEARSSIEATIYINGHPVSFDLGSILFEVEWATSTAYYQREYAKDGNGSAAKSPNAWKNPCGYEPSSGKKPDKRDLERHYGSDRHQGYLKGLEDANTKEDA